MQRPFNLRLWVVTVTLGTLLLVHAALGFVLTRYIGQQIISREGEETHEFLNSIVRAEGTADILMTPAGEAALTSFSHHLMSTPGFLLANIYGSDRVIRWSTDPSLIGTIPEEADDLDEALAGKVSTSLNAEIGDSSAAKQSGEERVIEAYLPIENASGDVVGVVEYYRDATTLRVMLDHVAEIVWLGALASSLVILIALYGAAARATRRIADQTAELQRLSVMASLGQMAAAVTHSLRNPLASIRSSVDLLQMSHPGLVDEAVADVNSEVDRIDRQVQDLLQFAGSGGGQAANVPLSGLVQTAVQRIVARAERDGVRIRTEEIAPDLNVHATGPLVLQVMENILTNAIEAMPDGGEISISSWLERGYVRLTIRDQGPGIPKSLVGKSPTPFQTTKLRGLGLGLSISDQLLSRFGGRLELSNAEDGGAAVSLILPNARRG
ncbi:ATP-binding protein [Paragemmobacter straminiformis]|uniref:histidine kinase n=1 Tax=Paragemmobacter straminiformis TaxID=2045119 RepID=A0A842I5V7_9RHOB|nr:ATP-binding protein [Gemmobacter straminiformis]MBC2835016.1 hypothetical protein [Gemmobacter straminiformis]